VLSALKPSLSDEKLQEQQEIGKLLQEMSLQYTRMEQSIATLNKQVKTTNKILLTIGITGGLVIAGVFLETKTGLISSWLRKLRDFVIPSEPIHHE
jgi:hypothetical protein